MVKRIDRPVALCRRVHHLALDIHFQHHLGRYVVCRSARHLVAGLAVAGRAARMRAHLNHGHEVYQRKRRRIVRLHAAHKQFERRLGAFVLKAPIFALFYLLQQLARLRLRQFGVRAEFARPPDDVAAPGQVGHQHALVIANRPRLRVLITMLHLGDGGCVQAALVRECAAAHIRLRVRRGHVGDFRHIAAGVGQRRQLIVRYAVHAHLDFQVGDDGDEVGVAAALAVAVHSALHLGCAGAHGGEGAGDRHVNIVVRVDAQRRIAAAANLMHRGRYVVRQHAPVGVAQHDALRTRHLCGANRLQCVVRVRLVAVKEMLGVKEHAPAPFHQIRHRVRDHGEVLFQRCLQDAGNMQIPALAHKGYDRRFGGEQCGKVGVVRRADVGVARAAECGERGVSEPHRLGALEELGVARVGAGPAAFDVMHAQFVKALADGELVAHRKRDPLALRAVPKCGVV